jgi:hypothetical protein
MAKQLEGVSGGGGVVARPVSYIEFTDTGSRYVELSAVKKTIAIVALGFVAGYFFCHSRSAGAIDRPFSCPPGK